MADSPHTSNLLEPHEASPPRPITARDIAAVIRNIQLPPVWVCALAGGILGALLGWATP
jgi:hypothetical protein